MTKAAPVVYLLHGEDEFAIARFVLEFEAKLGDPAMAAMNLSRLDGRSYNLDELLSVASAMPFLTKRRMVVLSHPTSRLTAPAARQKFLAQLEKIPSTTALVLVEYKLLTEERDRRHGKLHWLEKWAGEAGERVMIRAFPLPRGPAMARWIQDRAKEAGGQFSPAAAALLASLVGDEPRQADQEILKLLTYVNYNRAVEPEDVEALTADTGQGDVFAMVDALAGQDGRRSLGMLHRLLEQQDSFSLFGMIVRQFRLLLLAREVLDRGGQTGEVARELRVHPFVAEKVTGQARQFSLPVLEQVYHHLLDLDEAMKTGQMEPNLALDTWVADFTQ
jgi:DNA polymerase-3 subunit delta